MNRLPTIPVILTLIATAGSAADSGRAVLSLRPLSESTGSYPGHEGHRVASSNATFDLSTIVYGIRYSGCVDPSHGGQVAPIEGYIGMPEPSSQNWYHSGFLFIRINDQDIGAAPLSSMVVTENGTRAILDMVWRHPAASVRVRFVGLPGDDKLLTDIAIEPKGEVASISILARCYPSYFTAWNHRQGARRVKTPSTLVKEGENATLPPADNWSLLYYDEVFDVATGEGVGPCAMAILPDEATGVDVAPGGYAVDTVIHYRPSARRLRLAFWDLAGRGNADALRAFPKEAATAREQMAEMDFAPAALSSVDVAGRRAVIEAALAVQGLPEDLRKAAQEQLSMIEGVAPAIATRQEPGIEAEEQLLESLSAFEPLLWQIRLSQVLQKI